MNTIGTAIVLLAMLAAGCRTGLVEPTTTCNPPRDSRGRILRNTTARDEFMRQTGYPHGRPGYVVDHIIPLACCGPDTPANMQWLTIEEAKAKDRMERIGC